jgi:acyl-CoA thioesterase-2
LQPGPRQPEQDVWIRTNGTLPDDPLLHACIVAYASDLTLLDTATLPHAISPAEQEYQVASLDHAMWFHRPFRADEWMLYDQDSPSASGARGFARGRLFARDGRFCVSVAQEGMLRVPR